MTVFPQKRAIIFWYFILSWEPNWAALLWAIVILAEKELSFYLRHFGSRMASSVQKFNIPGAGQIGHCHAVSDEIAVETSKIFLAPFLFSCWHLPPTSRAQHSRQPTMMVCPFRMDFKPAQLAVIPWHPPLMIGKWQQFTRGIVLNIQAVQRSRWWGRVRAANCTAGDTERRRILSSNWLMLTLGNKNVQH